MLFQDFLFYFILGWKHIISAGALDHQLFILALVTIYSHKTGKPILLIITAFTFGHSITLLLSVLDIIRFNSRWVEFLIPCTIIFTSLSNVFIKSTLQKVNKLNYFQAIFFGLIHGMGFANTLRIMLAKDQNIAWGILGFNSGLEIGQVLILSVILFASYLIFRFTSIKPTHWLLFISAITFSIALRMAVERFPIKFQ